MKIIIIVYFKYWNYEIIQLLFGKGVQATFNCTKKPYLLPVERRAEISPQNTKLHTFMYSCTLTWSLTHMHTACNHIQSIMNMYRLHSYACCNTLHAYGCCINANITKLLQASAHLCDITSLFSKQHRSCAATKWCNNAKIMWVTKSTGNSIHAS